MAVKYVKDFEFPASGGFHNKSMPSRAGASAKGMPARAMPNAPARGAARMESKPKMGKGQGYASGGSVTKARGQKAPAKTAIAIGRPGSVGKPSPKSVSKPGLGPVIPLTSVTSPKSVSKPGLGPAMAPTSVTSPKSVSKPDLGPAMAPTSVTSPKSVSKPNTNMEIVMVPEVTYAKSSYGKPKMAAYAKGGKVAKVMREYKEGKLHSGSKKGPVVKNPKQAMAIALSEARSMKKAKGGEVFSDEYLAYGNKKGPYRGSPKKAKMLGRQDRRAREAMERAEKYAPGKSLDMPDRKAHGGMPMRRKAMYGGGKC